jgi:endonuclease/exonuclease/phosphatase family metal-dependent hydrolase
MFGRTPLSLSVCGRFAGVFVLGILLLDCRTGRDYPGATPRYAGAPAAIDQILRPVSDTLRIASFNIEFALRVDSALAVIRAEPELRGADVLLLQEMDAPSTRRIADALRMWYVYYPAIFHKRTKRDFGNAVLSRWPIIDDAKIVLPNPSRYAGTHRIATAATIQIGDRVIRAYSTHLGTIADVGGVGRREQLSAIIEDAKRFPIAIIAGDMNEGDLGEIALAAGFLWPTEKGPRTTIMGRWDHIFVRGLAPGDSLRAGTVRNIRGSSDHHPVWTTVLFPAGR